MSFDVNKMARYSRKNLKNDKEVDQDDFRDSSDEDGGPQKEKGDSFEEVKQRAAKDQ